MAPGQRVLPRPVAVLRRHEILTSAMNSASRTATSSLAGGCTTGSCRCAHVVELDLEGRAIEFCAAHSSSADEAEQGLKAPRVVANRQAMN